MPPRVARNQERAAEDAHRLAALRRRAAAEVKDVLVHADEAEHEARRTAETEEGTSERTGRAAPG